MSSLKELEPPIEKPLEVEDAHVLLSTLNQLRQEVFQKGQETFNGWLPLLERRPFRPSALNLAHYLAFREHDLRTLQTTLMPWGLSSLGRSEARVLPNLDAVIATLSIICKEKGEAVKHPPLKAFFRGDHILAQNVTELFGVQRSSRRIRIMVTFPTEAAQDYPMVKELVERGMNCARINCAHDTTTQWEAMIANVRRAEAETGLSCKVLMDLGGPKSRTGQVITPLPQARLYPGELMLLTPTPQPQQSDTYRFQAGCSLPEIFDRVRTGATVWIDDGKLKAVVEQVLPEGKGIELRVTQTGPKGVRLKPDKGLNFPDTVLGLSPLTTKDYADLDFIATHANIVGYSFVQEVGDLKLLQQALEERLGKQAQKIAIIAKIETQQAVHNLPELIVAAAGKHPFGVMIARGDLAVEIGYQRLAEIQEEILWLCEAAHIPVVWATQVLENLVSKGTPSRAEMTDAAMAERAECVMLNKGPFVNQAITILDDVLTRMQDHQMKKTPQLRALQVWQKQE